MATRHQLLKRVSLFFTLIAASLLSFSSAADISLAAYTGTVYTSDTDVRLSQPGGTELTFSSFSWDDESFKEPIFWGIRLTWWLALEFAHPKMVAKRDEVVHVSGVRAGTPVDTNEPLSNTFSHFEFTDGYNLLTFSGIHRWGHEHKRRYSFVP